MSRLSDMRLCLIKFRLIKKSLPFLAIFTFILVLWPQTSLAQSFLPKDFTLMELRMRGSQPSLTTSIYAVQDEEERQNGEVQQNEEYPDPTKVLYRSMILPGWGQVTNRQIWKVPIVYALFAGVGYYNLQLTKEYRGYRAAYYNVSREESDFKYGATPDFVPDGLPAQQLKATRDNLRNQRDFSYVLMVLAYGLNVLDAYIYAHMRSFDVSDDLSAQAQITPELTASGPGIQVRIHLK